MPEESTLEIVYIDVMARDAGSKQALDQIAAQVRAAATSAGAAVSAGVTEPLRGAAAQAGRTRAAIAPLDQQIDSLSKTVRGTRAAYQAGFISEKQFADESVRLKSTLQSLTQTEQLNVAQTLKVAQAGRVAESGLANLRGEGVKLGLAQNVNIGLANKLQGTLSRFGPVGAAAAAGLSSTRGALNALFPAAVLAGIGVGVATLKRAADEVAVIADRIDKGSQAAGLSIEAYQELGYVLSQNGVDADGFDLALGTLNKRIGDAAAGNPALTKTFQNLGISVRTANGEVRSTEDVFTDVIHKLSEFPDAAVKSAAASDLFGDRVGRRLLPTLNAGAAGLAALRQEARDMGLVISGEAVISLVKYGDQVAALEKQFQTAKVEIVAGFLPVLQSGLIPLMQNGLVPLFQAGANKLETLTTRFYDAGEEGTRFRGKIADGVVTTAELANNLLNLGRISVGLVQVLTAPFAALGDVIGTVSVKAGYLYDALQQAAKGDFGGAGQSLSLAKQLGGLENLGSVVETFSAQARAGLDNVEAGVGNIGNFDRVGLKNDIVSGLNSVVVASQEAGNLFSETGRELGNDLGTGVATGVAGSKRTVQDIFTDVAQAGKEANQQAAAKIAAGFDPLLAQLEAAKTRAGALQGALSEALKPEYGASAAQVQNFADRLKAAGDEAERLQRASTAVNILPQPVLTVTPKRAIPKPEVFAAVAAPVAISGSVYDSSNGTYKVVIEPSVSVAAAVPLTGSVFDASTGTYKAVITPSVTVAKPVAIGGSVYDESTGTYKVVLTPTVTVAKPINIPVPEVSATAGKSVELVAPKVAASLGEYQIFLNQATGRTVAFVEAQERLGRVSKDVVETELRAQETSLSKLLGTIPEGTDTWLKYASALATVRMRLRDIDLAPLNAALSGNISGLSNLDLTNLANQGALSLGPGGNATIPDFRAEYSPFAVEQRKDAAEVAEQQRQAAESFASTVVSAGAGFAQEAIQGIIDGDIAGIVRSAFSAGSSILGGANLGSIGGFGVSSLVSAGLGIFGSLTGLIFGGGSNADTRRSNEEQRRSSSVPAITISFDVVQNNNYSGGPRDPASEQAYSRNVDELAGAVLRNILPRLDKLEARV